MKKYQPTLKQKLLTSEIGMQEKPHVLIVNGPNLNMLGKREPEVYGYLTLQDIEAKLVNQAADNDIKITFFQSNAEYEIIDFLHSHYNKADYVIINPAAFTHTSVAIRDALLAIDTPFIELHLSNVHAREKFRHHSYFSDIAQAVICGLGAAGYEVALQHTIAELKEQ